MTENDKLVFKTICEIEIGIGARKENIRASAVQSKLDGIIPEEDFDGILEILDKTCYLIEANKGMGSRGRIHTIQVTKDGFTLYLKNYFKWEGCASRPDNCYKMAVNRTLIAIAEIEPQNNSVCLNELSNSLPYPEWLVHHLVSVFEDEMHGFRTDKAYKSGVKGVSTEIYLPIPESMKREAAKLKTTRHLWEIPDFW